MPPATTETHKVFGVDRRVDISDNVFPTAAELEEMEGNMPPCETGWFDSSFPDTKLFYRKFLPAGKPKAIVVFQHGIQTHSGNASVKKDGTKHQMALRAERMIKEGYALYALDMCGHGYSEGTRWFIGDSYKKNVDDLVNFVNLAASFHEDKVPLFISGESFGGTLVIHAARRFQDNPESGPATFDSAILLCPAVIGDLPPYPIYFVLRYMLAPAFPRWVPFFMPNPVSAERIWRDPEVLAYKTAPRRKEMCMDGSGKPFRLGTAVQMLRALDDARTTAIPGFKVPFCLIHGTNDHAVPIEGSDFLDQKAATPAGDKVYLKVQGGYHDLLSDPEGNAETTIQTSLAWIKTRLAKQNI